MTYTPHNPYEGDNAVPSGQTPYPEYPGYNDTPVPKVRKISEAFRENALPWVLSAVLYVAVAVVIDKPMANVLTVDIPVGGNQFVRYPAFSTALELLISLMAGVNYYRNAILAIDGHKLEFKDFFSFQFLGYYFLTSLVVAVVIGVGLVVLIVPGLVLAYFSYWALLTSVDYTQAQRDPISAMKRSFSLSKNNVGTTFLVSALSLLVGFVIGAILGVLSHFFVLGSSLSSIIILPVFALIFAYYYRQIQPALA